jgi:hypothetical protein
MIFMEFLLNAASEKVQSLSEYEAMQIVGFHECRNENVRLFIQKHFHWLTMKLCLYRISIPIGRRFEFFEA